MSTVLQALTGVVAARQDFGGSPLRGSVRFPLLDDSPRHENVSEISVASRGIEHSQQLTSNNMYQGQAFGQCTACRCPGYVKPGNSLIRCEACDHAPYAHIQLQWTNAVMGSKGRTISICLANSGCLKHRNFFMPLNYATNVQTNIYTGTKVLFTCINSTGDLLITYTCQKF
jgi:hypothetical protein